MTKQEALAMIQSIPTETFTMDDILYHLYVRQKVEKGLQEIRDGKFISHDDLKKQWKVQ